MKILQVIPYFVPAYSYGGPVKVCFDISEELARKDHDVTIATTDTLDGKNRIKILEENIGGIKILRFKNVSNKLAKSSNGYLPIGFYSWCKDNVRNFDIVHCHDFFTYQNIVVSHFCKKYNIPLIIQPHGSSVPERARGRKIIKTCFNILWGKRFVREAKYIIALTNREQSSIKRYFSVSKVEIVLNGIATHRTQSEHTYNVRKKYGLKKDSFLLFSMGRLHAIKGFDLLIKAFHIFNRQFPNSYLFIAGPDEGDLENLKDLVAKKQMSEHIFFTGMVLDNEKRAFLSESDLFALFSRNEPFPLVILEALEAGTPVVLSEKIGIASTIEKYGSGKIIDAYDSEGSAKILRECVTNLTEMKSRTKETIKQFDITSTVDDILKLYNRSVSETDKLKFEIKDTLSVGEYAILYDNRLKLIKNSTPIKEIKQLARFTNLQKKILESIIYNCISLRNYLFVDGFIQVEIKKLISKYLRKNDVFLEIGCGDMSISRYLPKNKYYNAFDISLHRYYLNRLLKHNKKSNVCLASIHSIPLSDNCVSFLVLSEVLYELPDISKAISEVSRIVKKDGLLIISLSNAYCHKYKKKGNHPLLKNSWTFGEFIDFANKNNFKLLQGYKKGWWIPLPTWLTKISYQLPITSRDEYKNTTFFYVFKKL